MEVGYDPMDRSDRNRRLCAGDYFFTAVFPRIIAKECMELLVGTFRPMVVGICRAHSLATYALVG
jgi:hypothetical protein